MVPGEKTANYGKTAKERQETMSRSERAVSEKRKKEPVKQIIHLSATRRRKKKRRNLCPIKIEKRGSEREERPEQS